MSNAIWTIGHSNHPMEKFIELLSRRQIELLIDVRSSPYSRYASQFNREVLGPSLGKGEIRYLFLGDLLGGRAADQAFYDADGRVLYDRVAASFEFQRGIERLLREMGCMRTAILCGEEDPTNCHRRMLVGRVLERQGVQVLHLRGDGRAQTEAELAAEERFRKTKGQLNLFETEEPGQWRSTQSVSPKPAPPTSSRAFDGLESAE